MSVGSYVIWNDLCQSVYSGEEDEGWPSYEAALSACEDRADMPAFHGPRGLVFGAAACAKAEASLLRIGAQDAADSARRAAVVQQPNTALGALGEDAFAADAGAGMEGATSESFAIPFLGVLQKGSPQADEADGAFVKGARPGMFFENVSGSLHDGKAGITLVPCAYRRVFLRWGPKGVEGSGFKGELTPEAVAQLRADSQVVDLDGRLYFPMPDGTVSDKKCDRVADVRNHYCLLVDPKTGAWTQVLLSLGSTQIKKSKMLMSALASVRLSGAAGLYTPPTFAQYVHCVSVPESNDKGTWHGVKFELGGRVDRAEVYAAARAFHASVAAGQTQAKYDDAQPVAGEDRKF